MDATPFSYLVAKTRREVGILELEKVETGGVFPQPVVPGDDSRSYLIMPRLQRGLESSARTEGKHLKIALTVFDILQIGMSITAVLYATPMAIAVVILPGLFMKCMTLGYDCRHRRHREF